MQKQLLQGLVIGAIVGAALAVFMYTYNNNLAVDLIMVPIGALMGAAPWLLKPKED